MINKQAKYVFVIGVTLVAIIAAFFFDPIAQDPNYHKFVDTRSLWFIPNAGDVLSNVGFLVVGLWGLLLGATKKFPGGLPSLYRIYSVLFLGIFLTAFGSSFYHWSPSNASLVWDRLPMTIAFMSFFTMVIAEQMDRELALLLFGALLCLGVFSVAYWYYTEQKGLGDLRLYILVQFLPIVLIPLLLLMFESPFTSNQGLWLAIACYLLAKLCEILDADIYQWQLGFSGHSIKHLFAALGAGSILWALQYRQPRFNRP